MSKGIERTKPNDACPKCQRHGDCYFIRNRTFIRCMKVAEGAEKTGVQKDGRTYYQHRLVHDARAGRGGPPAKAGKVIPAAAAEKLDEVYRALLARLALSEAHRQNLRDRGLDDATIEREGYRTIPDDKVTRIKIAKELLDKFGDLLYAVPGIVWKDGKHGAYATISSYPGMLIPCRDHLGRIVALKIRRDVEDPDERYRYLTSKHAGGPTSNQPVAIPLGVDAAQGGAAVPITAFKAKRVRVTEGELKAVIAFQLSGLPTIALPGVNNRKDLKRILLRWGVGTVVIAFDVDACLTPEVAIALETLVTELRALRLNVELEVWDEHHQHKGIDDLLAAGLTPRVLAGDEVTQEVERLMVASGGDKKKATGKDKEEKKSAASSLYEFAIEEFELFHSPDGIAYGTTLTSPRKTFALNSKSCNRLLRRLHRNRTGTSLPSDALIGAIGDLEWYAIEDCGEKPVFLRLGGDGEDTIELDLADSQFQSAIVGPGGWRIATPAERFIRAKGMLAIPAPSSGGDIELLRPLLNLSKGDWYLFVSFLLGCLNPRIHYPVLCLHGEQGSGKSTMAKIARRLIDPNSSMSRTKVNDVRDLMIAATNSWIISFDNLSHLSRELSDNICSLSTGGGYTTRELHTDAEQVIFDVRRPVILNGIEDVATMPDLLERCLIVRSPAFKRGGNILDSHLWKRFDEHQPRILGALLDAVAFGLHRSKTLELAEPPRMADFAHWVTSCEKGLGWPEGTFLMAYEANQQELNALAIESSVIAGPIQSLRFEDEEWEGSAAILLGILNDKWPDKTKEKGWPKKPHIMSGMLRRIAPNLRKLGVDVQFFRAHGGERKISITFRPQNERKQASPASPASPEAQSFEDKQDADTQKNRPSVTQASPKRHPSANGEVDL